MKIEEITGLVEKHTTEGAINYEELNKEINLKFDALIDAKVNKAKDSVKGEVVEGFIKDQGFENIDQYNAFIKNTKATSTELAEKVTRYEQELDAVKGENNTYKSKVENFEYMGKLADVDSKYQEFVMSKVKGLVNDETDFETAKTQYLADNAHYLKDNTQIVTKLPKGGEKTTQQDGVVAILEGKHGIKLE